MSTSHKDLIVWQKSIALAGRVYAATGRLPSDERFGLAQQLRLTAVCVASAIAEGSARMTRAEFIESLEKARAALAELETQITIAVDLGLIPAEAHLEDIADVGRRLNALIRSRATSAQAAHARSCAPIIPTTGRPLRSHQTHT